MVLQNRGMVTSGFDVFKKGEIRSGAERNLGSRGVVAVYGVRRGPSCGNQSHNIRRLVPYVHLYNLTGIHRPYQVRIDYIYIAGRLGQRSYVPGTKATSEVTTALTFTLRDRGVNQIIVYLRDRGE